jgi:hypothetical protein
MALSPATLVPPLNSPPVTPSGQHSPAWTDFYQGVANRLAALGTGVRDGSDAAAGQVGEFMTASSGAVTLTNNSVANVVPLTLTPGDWDVSGLVSFSAGAGTHTSFGTGLDTVGILYQGTYPSGAMTQGMGTPPKRYNVTANTVVNLVAIATFTSGTMSVQGVVRARRMR